MLTRSSKRISIRFVISFALVAFASAASAQESAQKSAQDKSNNRIQSVQVVGLKKIDQDVVIEKLSSKVGNLLDSEAVRTDIDSVFATGYFKDIQVSFDSGQLTFQVIEKPSVSEIIFTGNTELDESDLKEATEIESFQILDLKKVRIAVEKIRKLYEDKGYFLAKVESEIVPTDKEELVQVKFKISENDKVTVKRIKLTGFKRLSESKLKGVLATQEGGAFSFISGSGSYKQEAFDRDVKMLQFLYYNEGFIQVKIGRPEVYVTPDKRSIIISISIEEGEQFKVSTVDFAGDILFSDEKLRETVKLSKDQTFSYQTMQTDLSSLQALYGDLGYAFANILPRTKINDQDKTVDVIFEIDKGEKVYFGEINVIGNTKTRDKVIRREIRIYEGELYNETAKRTSIENIQRLGFFEEVNFKSKTPADRPNRMDIDVVVKERNTGSVQFGAGLASGIGFTLQGQVNQINFMGKGQSLGANINYSQIEQIYRFSFTEPFFMDSTWSTGSELYRTVFQRSTYLDTREGGSVSLGHPFNDYLRLFGAYNNYFTTLRPAFGLPPERFDREVFPESLSRGRSSSMRLTLEYDRRNDRFNPSKGFYGQVGAEYVGLGGDFNYTRGNVNVRWYKNIFWELVFRSNFTYAFLQNADGNSENLPFTERFLLGGPNSLRGFRFFQVGQRRFSTSQRDFLLSQGFSADRANELAFIEFGGAQQFFYNLEIEFPLIKEAGIRGVLFYDAGQAEDQIKLDELYANFGFGVRWFSPVGPLRFEFGFPTKRDISFHESQNFIFSIGSPF